VTRVEHGPGVVSTKTFLGSLTRVSVMMGTGLTVRVDLSSAEASSLLPGDSVTVTVSDDEVLVTDAQPA
jgi:hypothetical protein